ASTCQYESKRVRFRPWCRYQEHSIDGALPQSPPLGPGWSKNGFREPQWTPPFAAKQTPETMDATGEARMGRNAASGRSRWKTTVTLSVRSTVESPTARATESFSPVVSHTGSGGNAARM